jgi:pSer/pThr/pTyr-binding forkhead associated (FHA) protein/DNA-binding CsgD family transcriptional regulator
MTRSTKPSESHRALLEIVSGTQAGHVFELAARDYTLGRGRDCDLVLRDRAVSRRHARLRFDGSAFIVEDTESAHGVFVDSVRVSEARLQAGSVVTLGGVMLRYATLDSEASTTTQFRPPRPRGSLDSGSRTAAVAALDRLRIGIVLVDPEGRVLLANRTAETLLADGDGIGIARNRIDVSDASASRQLAALLREDPGHRGGALTVARARAARPLTLMVTPLRNQRDRLGTPLATRAVFISDPDRGLETSEQLLARLYDLTPAEARVATLLVQGYSLEEASDELGVAVGTSRSHLKSIFQKTECRRQSDLVRLLLAGPSLLRED